jgi:hypothetical protein
MKRRHALLISLIAAAAAVFGTFAATHSVRLARSSPRPAISSEQIAARSRSLDRTEAALHRILAGKPVAGRSSRQRVVFVRPAPHVVTLHRSGEHEAESGEQPEGFDD